MQPTRTMKDFFISYNKADITWAEWIAWQLEEKGYSIVIQAWDSQYGQDFVEWMHKAVKESDRTIAVLSSAYLESEARFSQMERNAALYADKLLPIRVQNVEDMGLFGPIAYIDLVGLEEDQAREKLLREVVRGRKKPGTAPSFPGAAKHTVKKPSRFPGVLPPVWNLPFHRNPNFTGRAELLAELRAALTKDKTAALTQAQAIHGLGGVGKTQLALEYAFRFAAEFQIVWWLRAEEAATLAADFAALATALNLPEKEAQDQTAIIHAVRQWLDHHTGWLFIFDNAQQPQDLLPYLPQAVSGQVLITSRTPRWKGVAHALKVQVWPRAEAVAFLLHRSGDKDEQTADAVAEALGDLPLALEQASAYMEATAISLAEYIALFQQFRADLLREHRPLEYPDPVATTWEMAFQKLKAEEPVAIDLLNALAFLAPDNIPRVLLIDHREHLPESLAEHLSKPLVANRAIASLARYSMVEANVGTLSLHRLVQTVTRDRFGEGEQKVWAEAVLKIVNYAWPVGTFDFRSWPECARLLPHSYAVAEHAEKCKIESTELAALLVRMGFYLTCRAVYNAAEQLYRRSLEIREKQLGPDHPDVAQSLNNLAGLLRAQGQYAAAEPLFRRSLVIWEKQLGRDHPQAATGLSNLAGLLRDQGQYAAAEPLDRRSLEIREKQLGPDHPSVATGLNNLAGLLRAQGQYVAAEPLYRRSLEI